MFQWFSKTLWLQHTGNVRHHILIMCEGLLNGFSGEICVKAGDGVVHLSRQWESYLDPDGKPNLLFVDPNNAVPSNA